MAREGRDSQHCWRCLGACQARALQAEQAAAAQAMYGPARRRRPAPLVSGLPSSCSRAATACWVLFEGEAALGHEHVALHRDLILKPTTQRRLGPKGPIVGCRQAGRRAGRWVGRGWARQAHRQLRAGGCHQLKPAAQPPPTVANPLEQVVGLRACAVNVAAGVPNVVGAPDLPVQLGVVPPLAPAARAGQQSGAQQPRVPAVAVLGG